MDLAALGKWLDSMILKVFSILNDYISLMETDSAATSSSLHTEGLTAAVK